MMDRSEAEESLVVPSLVEVSLSVSVDVESSVEVSLPVSVDHCENAMSFIGLRTITKSAYPLVTI